MKALYVCKKVLPLATSLMVGLSLASCFKTPTSQKAPGQTSPSSFEAFYNGGSGSYIQATLPCSSSDAIVVVTYSSSLTPETTKEFNCSNGTTVASGKSAATTISASLNVKNGLSQQTFTILIRNRLKNVISQAVTQKVEFIPSLGSFNVSGVTGSTDTLSDNWLSSVAKIPEVTFEKSEYAKTYTLSIKDAGGTSTICGPFEYTPSTESSTYTYDTSTCALNSSTTYQAVVKSTKNGLEREAANSPFSFSTDDSGPTAAAITGATGSDDSTVDAWLGGGVSPIANWTAFTNAGSYTVTIKDSSGTTTLCSASSIAAPATSYTFSGCTLVNATTYKLYVTALSGSGVWSTSATNDGFDFTVDTTAPTAPSVSGTTPTNSTTPTWSWVAGGGGNGTFRYRLDNSDLSSGTTSTTSLNFTPGSALSAGTHTLYVQERDTAGNWSSSGSFDIDVDLTAPTAPTVSCAGVAQDTTPDWSWAAGGGGNGNYRYKLDDSDLTSGATATTSTNYTSGVLAEGAHILYVQERDAAGNWSSSGSCTNTVDNTGPSAPVITPVLTGYNGTNDTTPTFNWVSGGGGGSGTYRYKFNDSDFTSGTTTTTSLTYTVGSAQAEGTVTMYVQEQDAAGNWSATGSADVLIDTTALATPTLGGGSPTADSTIGTTRFIFSWNSPIVNAGARCGQKVCYYNIEKFTNGTCTGAADSTDTVDNTGASVFTNRSYDYTSMTNGTTYSIKIYAVDGAGNISTGKCSKAVTVDTSHAANVTGLAGGKEHFCALVAGGAWCWGSDDNNQLGTGTGVSTGTPAAAPGVTSGATQITAGQYTTYALVSGGVKSWGSLEATPEANGDAGWVSGLGSGSGVTYIDAGESFACAVVNGGVKCWGSNASGQLGDGSTTDSYTVPVTAIAASSNVTMVKAGYNHACALFSGGTVKCWGANAQGQLGNGTQVQSLSPVDVSGLTSVQTIEAGDQISCATNTSGALKCWGMVAYSGSNAIKTTAFDYPDFTSSVTQVNGTFDTGCALKSGDLYCVGWTMEYEVLESGVATYTAYQMPNIPNGYITDVQTGYKNVCGIVSGGVVCWGDYEYKVLGDNYTGVQDTDRPQQILFPIMPM